MEHEIYFCGSIKAGREDAPLYAKIIEHLRKYGTVLSEHVGDEDPQTFRDTAEAAKFIHERDVAWLTKADLVVAEVTVPSLGVGYEIGRAVALNKPILVLYRPDSTHKLSSMIQGAHDGNRIIVKHYKDSEYIQIIDEFVGKTYTD